MHYTSGTTGRPKGVTTGLWDEDTARAVFEDEAAVWQFDRDDLHLVCSPMYHTVSIRFSAGTLLSGGSLAILSRFDAAAALGALRQHRPTTAFLVPTHLQRILQLAALGPDERVRLATSARACRRALPRVGQAGDHGPGRARHGLGVLRVHRSAVHRVPARRMARAPGHGGPGPHRPPPLHCPDRRRPGGGEAGPGAVRRRRHDLVTMPDFARFAYWRNERPRPRPGGATPAPSATWARSMREGYLYLTGRRHDLIISGGVNVYPAEVENVLAAVDGVAEVAVFGLPDEQWGQRVCAAYVAEGPGAEEALRAAASSGLAPYKRPKSYVAAPDLPHTATGKLIRRAVPEHLGLVADRRDGRAGRRSAPGCACRKSARSR